MGVAESKTMNARRIATAKRLINDPTLPSASQQRNTTTYFSASLVQVSENGQGETLTPITAYVEPEEKLDEAYYCVSKGTRFEIVLKLARPSPPGVSFGARVYLDSGDTHTVHSRVGKNDDSGVFDHYIWFGPGATSYTIKGFFADADTSIPFLFGSPKKHPRDENDTEFEEEIIQTKSSGCVRIQFARVLKWVPKASSDDQKETKKKKIRRLADTTKGNELLVQATGDAQTDGRAPCIMDAVLSPDCLFESRIFYNSFAGYTAQASTGTALLDPEAFRGLPLDILQIPDVRRRCLDTFLRACQHGHFEQSENQRLDDFSQTGHSSLPPTSTNSPVSLPKLATCISTTLSRTASYLICTGTHKDYGESVTIQTFDTALSRQDLLAHLDTKVKALHTYFSDRPDLYKFSVMADGDSNDDEDNNAEAVPTSRWFKKFSNRYNTTGASTKTQKKKGTKITHAVTFAEIEIDLSGYD